MKNLTIRHHVLTLVGLAFLFLTYAGLTSVQAAHPKEHRLGPNTTLSFDAKQTTLSQESKDKLDALIKEAKASGKINEVRVAVWSDNPAPRPDEQLSKPDRELAEKRAKAVSEYLKSYAKVGVDTVNMAERANWLSRTFNTEEAELKKEIGRGDDTIMSKQEFQVFKDNGSPSRAVVLIIYE